ncbi:LysR family transcriptional regulator [Pseudovibrio exalbescens]|uniref:LysR family transcriptional regulator n=1 Tax=Pseudovibrio exalbescens TaxID=197461 RepID=UPI0023654E0F|nr:LysR family transcriptional regulator [Pseudovibrio exalbescens]MDD7911630.1 LysR family transcriptional regulator [Pseudovibrio exalbescens]
MRLPLTHLEIFSAIAKLGSLRAAAEHLGLKASTVSHQLKKLEEDMGVALFVRTTRSIQLTEAGRALHEGTQPAFEQLSAALQEALRTGKGARGALRISLPELAYQLILKPILPQFMEAFPEIELEFNFSDGLADVIGEGFHAGIRFGDLIQQDMVAIPLTGPLKTSVVAAPSYLKTTFVPDHPRELLGHNCLRYRYQTSRKFADWDFKTDGGRITANVSGNMVTNSLPVLLEQARSGVGLAYMPRALTSADQKNGTLVELLKEFSIDLAALHLYFPKEYRSITPLRSFIDFLKPLRLPDRDQVHPS